MEKIAIYDLDRTITRIGTFTPFLIFATSRAHWRKALLPFYFLAMPAYAAGLITRRTLKQWGFMLAVGRKTAPDRISELAFAYAEHVLTTNLNKHVTIQIAKDRAEGFVLVIATAAPEIYATEIGAGLGFDHVLATRQSRWPDGDISHWIEGENCYGKAKLQAIEEWLPGNRESFTIRFYSDHHTDIDVFDWCDEPIATNPNTKLQALAHQRGWRIMARS